MLKAPCSYWDVCVDVYRSENNKPADMLPEALKSTFPHSNVFPRARSMQETAGRNHRWIFRPVNNCNNSAMADEAPRTAPPFGRNRPEVCSTPTKIDILLD